MEKRNLYIVVVIVLVLGLALSFAGFTGNSVLGKCTDTDNGDSPYIPGIASYSSGTSYKDECYSTSEPTINKYLNEKYCLDKITTKRYFCGGGCVEDENGVGYCAEGEADDID